MDLVQLWAEVIQRVSNQPEYLSNKDLIGLLGSQTSIQIANNKVTFICNSDFVYRMFFKYVPAFFTEVTHLIGNESIGMEVIMASNLPQNNVQQFQSQASLGTMPGNQNNSQFYQQSMVAASGAFASSVNQTEDPRKKLPKFMREDHINPEKTFENYITDPENELIFTIAKKVATEPGSSKTNPFYIYGGSGLGKTHLLFAIANRIRQTKPNISLIYTRAEEFIRNYVESMSRKNSFDYQQVHFQDLFTQQDVFIVDDIQNFIKGPKARDTFFDIIADFLEKPNRQLILASDVPPGNLKDFSPRLKSRFGSGVCREIYPPSTETRAAITLKKCRELNIELPDSIMQYIANHIRSNVREIEGAIKTLNSHILAYGSITYDEAVKSLANLVNVSSQITTIDSIKERVSKEFEVTVTAMESAERKKAVSTARAFAMTLASDLIPNLSQSDIGRAFNKDHSSVFEAIRRTKKRMENDIEMAAIYQKLTLSLKKD
ncbi:MAG: DnaA/Hda family protein [Succinatimonas sp.]|nr:DnaA/Hda family protein [Succinatimonas sp.]